MNVPRRLPRRSPPRGELMRILLASLVIPGLVAAGAALFVYWFLDRHGLFGGRDDETLWIREASQLIADRYYEPVSAEQLALDAIRGMAMRDAYSYFVDPDHEAAYSEENEGRYVGIGFAVYQAGEPVTVLYAFPGSPAEGAGLESGDRIVGVDGVDCTGKTSDEIIDRIKIVDGEGQPVTIRVRPYAPPGTEPSPDREVTVKRATIWRPTVVDPRIVEADRGIAYVRLKAFQEHSAEELREALIALTKGGMKSLVLDLRGNRGGLLDQAVDISSLFLEDGVVVMTRGRAPGTTDRHETNPKIEPLFHELPLVLLVDEGSASASEIVAGALQDYQRALLVGERTYGKGMVQTVISREYLVDGKLRTGRLKITTSRYFTPAGHAIEEIVRDSNGLHIRKNGSTGLWPDILAQVDDQEEELWLERYLDAREIPADTWRLIEERCPKQPHVREGTNGYQDRQLETAIEILSGTKLFRVIS